MATTIVTRADKGSALTHSELDQNFENLKTTADAAEAKALALETENPDWKKHLPTRAEFEALVADRRDAFAGSGFIEWGRSRLGGYLAINQGLHVDVSAGSSLALHNVLGSATSAVGQWSKSIYPIANVNGYILSIYHVRLADRSQIIFPPAPATAAILDRQDLVFLEVWHEDISEKDFVYPLGNVQFGGATYTPPGGTAIPCANGAFAGYDTYSLFGNWQAAGDLVGKGAVWSTMTDTQKQEFVADPVNNCYLDGDKVIQVRYRVRVIEGAGSGWSLVDPTKATANLTFSYAEADKRVKPKGKRVSIPNDLAVYEDDPSTSLYADFMSRSTLVSSSIVFGTGEIGLWGLRSPNAVYWPNYAYGGRCFALPIALVQRRNQGDYHPVWNPNGSAKCLNADNVTAKLWYETDRVYTSAADCFLYKSGGDIASGVSGRPEGLFYDEINERDVLDLRNSAHKVRDLKRTMEREFNNLVAGLARGWEESPTFVGYMKTTTGFYYNGGAMYNGLSSSLDITETVLTTGKLYLCSHPSSGYAFIGTAFSSRALSDWRPAPIGKTPLVGTVLNNVTGDLHIFELASNPVKSKTILQCDVVGDPANYPADWVNNGIKGTPLLLGENGEDLIPDGTQKTFKMSRKCKTHLLALYSMDNGATWQSSGYFPDAATNDYTASMPVNRLQIHFYETEASPLEPATNAEVLAHGNAWAGNRYRLTNFVTPFLIGKVPVADSGFCSLALPMKARVLDVQSTGADKLWTGDTLLGHEALPSVFPTTNPAVKVLPYLTRENGRLYLQAIFKEMNHNGSSWGDDSKFNVVDKESTIVDNNAETVKIGQKRLELPFYIGDGE